MILNDLRLSYHDTVSGVDFQKKLKIHAAHPRRSILAAWIFNFFSYYIWYSTVIQYCIYTTVYTVPYSTVQYCAVGRSVGRSGGRAVGRSGGRAVGWSGGRAGGAKIIAVVMQKP